MEVLNYARSRRRGIAAVVLMGAIAAAVSFSLVRDPAPRFRAGVYVAATGNGASQLETYAANFQLLLRSRAVVSEVSRRTQEPSDLLNRNLAVDRVGQSSQLRLTYSGATAAGARMAVEAAAVSTLVQIAESERTIRAAAVRRLEAVLASEEQALSGLQEKAGLLYPDEEYRNTTAELREAEINLKQAEAVGDTAEMRQLRVELDALVPRQAALVDVVRDYERLRQRQATVQEPLREARRALLLADAASKPEEAAANLRGLDLVRESSVRPVVQAVAATFILAVGLGFAVLLLPALWRGRGATESVGAVNDVQSSGSSTVGPN